MGDTEKLVVLAINVEPVQLPMFKEILEENHIELFVTGGNQGYGARGEMYVARGVGNYTLRVRKSDEIRAIEIMQNAGFNIFSEDKAQDDFLEKIAAPTEKIPLLAKYSLYTRLSIMAITITVIIVIIMLLLRRVS